MMACTRCWRKARPIYKQHILALYPSHAESQSIIAQHPTQSDSTAADYSLFTDPLAQPRNLSDLTYYAQMFPNRLTKIGAYMLKKLKQRLAERHTRFVHLTVVAMIGLVDACHSDDLLILYDLTVCEALRLLLNHPHMEHRILAAQGLCKLMGYIDDAADFRKYDPFFTPLVAMCTETARPPASRRDDETIRRVRMSGLQAMSAMVIHFYPQRLVDHYDEVLPAVLANVGDDLQQDDKAVEGEAITSSSLSSSAYETLSLVAAKVSIPDLDSALTPLFAVLDSWSWAPQDRCAAVMSVLTNGVQSDSDLVLFELLKHALLADDKQKQQQGLKARMLAVAASLIGVMRVNALHWEGMVDLLIHHTLNAAKPSSSYVAYDQAVLACFSSYARKLPAAQDLISLLFHLAQSSYTDSPPMQVKVALLHAAHNIAAQARDLAVGADAVFTSLASVESLVRSLLTCAMLTQAVPVRELVYAVLLNLLLPPAEGDEDSAGGGGSNGSGESGAGGGAVDDKVKVRRFMNMIGEGKRGGEKGRMVKLNEKEHRWILTILYYELSASIVSSPSGSTAPSSSSLQPSHVVISPAVSTSAPASDAAVSSSLPAGAGSTTAVAANGAVSVDSVVVLVDDERHTASSNISAPGRGSTSARMFELAYQILLCLLYHTPQSSLVLQWPMLAALYQLAQNRQLVSALNAARCHLLLAAWLCGVSRIFALNEARETRQHTAELDEYVKAAVEAAAKDGGVPCPDLSFDPEQMSRGLVAAASSSSILLSPPVLDSQQVVRVLSRLLDASGTGLDADESDSAAETPPPPSNLLQLPFEPFSVKFLPPLRLSNEEREASWAPSHRPDRERRYSFDVRDSITRVDSPFHSPRVETGRGSVSTSAGIAVEGIAAVASGDDGKAVDDQSYAAVASGVNSQTARNEAAFKQSMRVLVDQTIHDDSVASPAHHHTPSYSSGPPSASSKPAFSRRRSLSTRRQSGLATGSLSSLSSSHHAGAASAAATADKFFAAPAVAAPPTLDVNAAIRQQIESSYALSPSHAVSGSVNVNGLSVEDDGAATPVKLNVRRSSRDMGGALGSGAGSGRESSGKGDGHADWTKESWALAEQRIDVSVDEDDEDDEALTDDIVYGLADDMEGITHHHIAGTSENILKFHFPVLNTFDSYSAEFDA